jgi:hypothetical protein
MTQEASAITKASQPAESQDNGGEQDTVDLDALAQRVLDLLKREVRIEGERIGRSWDL